MANEIGVAYSAGATLYAQVFNRTSGYAFNNLSGTFEVYSSLSGSLNSYAVSLTELGTASKMYRGNFPSQVGPGTFDIRALQRINAFYAESDPTVAVGQLEWAGSGGPYRALTDIPTSGQLASFFPLRATKGNAISGFMFKLVSSADHITPLTSGTPISGQISKNGTAFTSLQSGTAPAGYAEVGRGWYTIFSLTSGDMNADNIALSFQAPGSDPRDLLILTQP